MYDDEPTIIFNAVGKSVTITDSLLDELQANHCSFMKKLAPPNALRQILYSPKVNWAGFVWNRSGASVQDLTIKSKRESPLRVLSRLAKLQLGYCLWVYSIPGRQRP